MVCQLNLLGLVLTDSLYVIIRKALAKLLDYKPPKTIKQAGICRKAKFRRKIHPRLQAESEAHHRLIGIQVGEHLDSRAHHDPESIAGAGVLKTETRAGGQKPASEDPRGC